MLTHPAPDHDGGHAWSGTASRAVRSSAEGGGPRGRVDEPSSSRSSAPALANVDAALKSKLAALTKRDPAYWAFSHDAKREDAHAYFQYPAMMVPSMQRELLATILSLQPNICTLLEPFAGSGTIPVEAMYRGLSFRAQDVNPLAILLCKAKCELFDNRRLCEKAESLCNRLDNDKSNKFEINFSARKKWFTRSATIQLSRIRRAIRATTDVKVRRFFWVALAETIRQTSNSRTSTFKLHIRPQEEIAELPAPSDVFKAILKRNLAKHADFCEELRSEQRLVGGRYIGDADIRRRDSRKEYESHYDVLLTSPPYGDNVTTVPYGQHAYLPLQWIDLEDIDETADSSLLRTTHELDRVSLGGERLSFGKGPIRHLFEALLDRSKTLCVAIERLAAHPRNFSSRILYFVHDLDQAITRSCDALKENSYMFWTIGNRRVGGMELGLDAILTELMKTHGAQLVTTIVRRIPSKRMAIRNSVSATMREERIVVFRKAARALTKKGGARG